MKHPALHVTLACNLKGESMCPYAIPVIDRPAPIPANQVLLIASGDLRESANKVCWPAQAAMEKQLIDAFAKEGVTLLRAHPFDEERQHGFISSQRMGMDV